MLNGKKIMGLVPARSGSKGIPDKNMRRVGGKTLIGRAGDVLAACPWVDARVISTDSERYAVEGRLHGLDAFFLRPERLSRDDATAIDVIQHAMSEAEAHYAERFDVLLLVEPTSPLRTAEDLTATVQMMIEREADSVVTVSPLSTQAHPKKILRIEDGFLRFYLESGSEITSRHELLDDYWWRNGICYALTRTSVLQGTLFAEKTLAYVIDRPVVNIDDMLDLEWAEFLCGKKVGD